MPIRHDMLDPSAVMSKGTNSVNYVTGASSTDELLAGKNGRFTIVQAPTLNLSSVPFFVTSNPGAGNYVADGGTLYSYTHGLGYVPAIAGYIISPGSNAYTQLPFSANITDPTSGGALWWTLYLEVDTEVVVFRIYTMSYGVPWELAVNVSLKLYLMQQTSS